MRYADGVYCERGHVITLDDNKNGIGIGMEGTPFCPQCGASAVAKCPGCHKRIRGKLYVGEYDTEWGAREPRYPPDFCCYCGEAYPWTVSRIADLRAVLDGVGYKDTEAEALISFLPDLYSESPKVGIAAVKWKEVLAKVKGPALSLTKEILQTIGTEAAKSQLGLS